MATLNAPLYALMLNARTRRSRVWKRCRMPARTAASTRSRGPRALAGSGSSRTRAADARKDNASTANGSTRRNASNADPSGGPSSVRPMVSTAQYRPLTRARFSFSRPTTAGMIACAAESKNVCAMPTRMAAITSSGTVIRRAAIIPTSPASTANRRRSVETMTRRRGRRSTRAPAGRLKTSHGR